MNLKLGDGVTVSYCSKCGSILMDEANFCHKCGVRLNKNDLMNNIQKINTDHCNNTGEQFTEDKSRRGKVDKKPYKIIKIGTLIILTILLVGFGSYYICSLKLSASNTKKANTYVNLAPKSKYNSSNTSTDEKLSNKSKKDNSKSDVTSRIGSSDDYIFPNSGDIKLLDSDLSSLSKENLALARNEIFARHGYVFESEPYKSYFNGKSWYKANSKFKGSDVELNSVEKYNIQLIMKYEKR